MRNRNIRVVGKRVDMVAGTVEGFLFGPLQPGEVVRSVRFDGGADVAAASEFIQLGIRVFQERPADPVSDFHNGVALTDDVPPGAGFGVTLPLSPATPFSHWDFPISLFASDTARFVDVVVSAAGVVVAQVVGSLWFDVDFVEVEQ